MDTMGEYRFSSLVKQNKKAKICFVIHIAGEKKLLFYIYDVIVKQFFSKSSANHFWLTVLWAFRMPTQSGKAWLQSPKEEEEEER